MLLWLGWKDTLGTEHIIPFCVFIWILQSKWIWIHSLMAVGYNISLKPYPKLTNAFNFIFLWLIIYTHIPAF
jgi:hypothetical protein